MMPPLTVGRFPIEEGHIMMFARAIGDPNPIYRDRTYAAASPLGSIIAPPTFAIILTTDAGRQVIQDPDFGLDYSRVVHGEQRFAHYRPVSAGDVLQVVVTVDDVRVAAGNDIVTTRADVTTVEGEPVLTAWSTIVARGTAAA